MIADKIRRNYDLKLDIKAVVKGDEMRIQIAPKEITLKLEELFSEGLKLLIDKKLVEMVDSEENFENTIHITEIPITLMSDIGIPINKIFYEKEFISEAISDKKLFGLFNEYKKFDHLEPRLSSNELESIKQNGYVGWRHTEIGYGDKDFYIRRRNSPIRKLIKKLGDMGCFITLNKEAKIEIPKDDAVKKMLEFIVIHQKSLKGKDIHKLIKCPDIESMYSTAVAMALKKYT